MEADVFIAKLPTPPAGAVSQRVRFFKDGEFSHMHVLDANVMLVETNDLSFTATVDYGDEAGEQVGEVLPVTFEEELAAPPSTPEPAPEPPAPPAEETETHPESTEVAQ
jgi:hypothetical protein